MIEVVSTPFCEVVLLEHWNSPPGRFFCAYSVRGSSRWILGHSVIDEFGTLSTPIFLTPRPLLGKIYNAGLSLGHLRDHEMDLDLGWPPLCLGVDRPAPELPDDWQRQLLAAVTGNRQAADEGTRLGSLLEVEVPSYRIEAYVLGDAMVVGVSEPLLPRQLRRICESVDRSVVVAVSLGNRIERTEPGVPNTIQAISESQLQQIVETAAGFD